MTLRASQKFGSPVYSLLRLERRRRELRNTILGASGFYVDLIEERYRV